MLYNIIQTIYADWLGEKKVALDVLRLDKIHPVAGGNKLFKLKYYLQQAKFAKDNHCYVWGAWSNHIVAAAFACKQSGLKSIGIIRGEQPGILSETLKMAIQYGMELHFVSRDEYREKELIIQRFRNEDWYWINEGGYGLLGAKGASEILSTIDTSSYSNIVAAVGTGTMLAGLILSTGKQKVLGISCMKGNLALEKEILHLVAAQKPEASFQVIHDYHFGGYGKHPAALINFINEIYLEHNLPLDIVYTGKTFFAIKDLTLKNYFTPGSRMLMIHSGGLKGNNSLHEKVLAF